MNYQGLKTYHGKIEDEFREKHEFTLNIVIMVLIMVVITMVTIAVFSNIDIIEQDGAGTQKTLHFICRNTEEPETCFRVLKRVGERARVHDYAKAAINATLTELLVVNKPKPRLERSLNPLQSESYRDCLDLLNLGREELENLHNMANSYADLLKINLDDVINSLSAVISYQHTCSDELLRTNSYQILGYSLKIPIMLTRITLAIVYNLCEEVSNDAHQVDELARLVPSSSTERKMIESFQQPNVVVDQDGSGHFKTIAESLNACPKNNKSPCVIYVKKGRYEERVVVPNDVGQVIMYGDGPINTVVTGIKIRDSKIVTTSFRAATFVVMGRGFICRDMAFTAPSDITGAPALLVLADHTAFFNCKIDGEERSLFAVAQRQFYRNCEIHGSVDIIKGDSATVIQNSKIIIKPRHSRNLVLKRNIVSAQSKLDKNQRTGFVIQNCTITAQENENKSSLVGSTYLGTPYGEYSTTVVMESFLGEVIHRKGWCKWSDNYGVETGTFVEYNNLGPGARTETRVKWYGYHTVYQKSQMGNYTAALFIQAEEWLQSSGIPYEPSFVFKR